MGKAKRASIFIRLVSAAGTGFFYVKRKNPRRITEKLEFRKYDPRVNKHVLFTEAKMKGTWASGQQDGAISGAPHVLLHLILVAVYG
uniref:Large ribosomal subunit protein bL33c n=1 Tax=Aegilops tauschii TaxID=37682 RepID=M8CF32_AEGTA